MVDLRAKPFHLSDADVAWVHETIAGMSEDEKVGRPLVNLNSRFVTAQPGASTPSDTLDTLGS